MRFKLYFEICQDIDVDLWTWKKNDSFIACVINHSFLGSSFFLYTSYIYTAYSQYFPTFLDKKRVKMKSMIILASLLVFVDSLSFANAATMTTAKATGKHITWYGCYLTLLDPYTFAVKSNGNDYHTPVHIFLCVS